MVKKHKGGRRQILQLDDRKPSRSEWEPTSTATSNKEVNPLDSQVADFFREIDALTVNDHPEERNSEAVCASSEVASCSKQKDPEESHSQENASEKSESNQPENAGRELENYCAWQAICDQKTGYNYYWNVETNEVTWDCPSDYIMYLKNLQSTDGEILFQSNESNSNENHKKSKRKKPPKPPDGAIIPISYFGESSSSDDSSEEEKENGLGTTSKLSKCKGEPKASVSGQHKKNRNKTESKKEPYVETMGPHLPGDNHLLKTVSSASRTYSLKEAEISSKNEVDEYLEIGPQLASNSGINLSQNNDCNTVSDSSSKCTSVPQSVRNGLSVASSSTYEEPWEVSLMNIERKFRGLDQDIGEESPDSTVRKGDSLSENSVPCQTTNDTVGLRGVVEYDNFTDEEEEMSSSNISSSKQETVSTQQAQKKGYKMLTDQDGHFDCLRRHDANKSDVSQSESQQNQPKRKFLGKSDGYNDSHSKKSKQKDRLDIDNIFSNHANTGKYGFGFSRQEQLNMESEYFCSTSSHSSGKGSVDYKAINFVKSDHVFDLSTLNKNISNDSSTELKLNVNEDFNNNENICAPGPSWLNGVEECNGPVETITNESTIVENEDMCLREKCLDSNSGNSNSNQCLSLKQDSSFEENDLASELKDVSSSRAIDDDSLYKIEDIDEIDRQLSEALEAKKVENASKPSSSSPAAAISETVSPVSQTTLIESTRSPANSTDSGTLSDDIFSLSSLLLDKLTFLISSNSTLTTLGSLLIQIQTRLIDWQAGSLESRYFLARLQEVQQYLQHYEVGAVTGDWSCEWDRENKRYFYVNNRTQQSQWTYPEELCGKENSWMPSSADLASTSRTSSGLLVERDELQTVSSSVPEGQLHNKSSNFSIKSSEDISDKYSDSSMWISESSPPPPPPGVDSPPPPPPQSPPPDSPPPPPPDSTEVEDLLEDMDIEISDDSNPPLIVTNSQADTPADGSKQYQKFAISSERPSETHTSASVTNAVSSTSVAGFDDINLVSKSPQFVSTSHDTFDTADSVNMHWSVSQPSCSTDIASNFDSESEANVLHDPKLLPFDKNSDINASSSSNRICDVNTSSNSSKSCDVHASSSSSRSCDVNASSSSRSCDANASSSSSRSCDANASSSSSRNCDANASSSSSRSCDVNASSSSSRSCDVNASSSSSRSCDVNASSSSSRSCDMTTSSSSSRNNVCSNEVITYPKQSGPYPSTSSSVLASTTSTSKKEKKKAKLSSGLALKKKNIPSLVEKWQKIKEEQEKEDKD